MELNIGKFLIITGIVLTIIGVLWNFGSKWGLGKLPGDIQFKGEHYSFYFPIVSCIVISILISLVFLIFSRFK